MAPPTENQIRQFAWILTTASTAVTWWFTASLPLALATAGSGIGISWLRPQWTRPLFVCLTIVSWPIRVVVEEVLCILIYGLVITPVAMLLKLVGRDRLTLDVEPADSDTTTFWRPCRKNDKPEQYFHQF